MFVIDMTSITCEDLTDETWNQKLVEHLKSDDFFSVEKQQNLQSKNYCKFSLLLAHNTVMFSERVAVVLFYEICL